MSLPESKTENQQNFMDFILQANSQNRLFHSLILSYQSTFSQDGDWQEIVKVMISKSASELPDDINNYSDLNIVDGNTSLITKDQIIFSIDTLKQTSLSESGVKILVIKNVENSNKQALNSLLKFIESPTDKTFIIMTSHNVANILPTIRSRSQIISINNNPKEYKIKRLKSLNYPSPEMFGEIYNNLEDILSSKDARQLLSEILLLLNSAVNKPSSLFNDLYNLCVSKKSSIVIMILTSFFQSVGHSRFNVGKKLFNKVLLDKYTQIDYQKALDSIDYFNNQKKHNVSLSLASAIFMVKLEKILSKERI